MIDALVAAPAPSWPAIVDAVRACVGTRFRPQGRVPGLGLDCVGVVLVAAAAAGLDRFRPQAYSMGGDHEAVIAQALVEAGCRAVDAPISGDILVIAPAPQRRHLGVLTPAGMVHAHAGLGRVVEGPLDPDWTQIGAWRLPGAR
jgi:hypothetical protein